MIVTRFTPGFTSPLKKEVRLFSTSLTFNIADFKQENEVKFKTKNFIFENTNGYVFIKNILTSHETLEEKQKKIETALNEIWYNEINEVLQNKRNLDMNSFGTSLLGKDFNTLNKDIGAFNANAKKHKLPGIECLNTALIISIILGKVIPFSLRHPDILNQSTHSLFADIGKLLKRNIIIEVHNKIEEANLQLKKENEKKLTKLLASEMNKTNFEIERLGTAIIEYQDILNRLQDLHDDDLLRIGLGFTALLSEKTSFYSLEEKMISKNKSIRYIVPKNNLLKLIQKISLIDTIELPMIIPPYEWKIDENEEIIEYGGTILNNKHRFKPLRTRSVENSEANVMKYNKSLVNAVNFKSKISYTINLKLLEIITKDNFINLNKKGEIIFYNDIHPNTELLGNYMKERNNSMVNEITIHNSKFLLHRTIISIAKLMREVKEFYVTVFIDWRGRFYTSTSALNIQGGELARSLLLFKEGQKLNEIGLKALKIYTANAFGLDKKSKEERLNWVDANLHKIIDLDNNELWREADEPLLFLACALEIKGFYEDPNFMSHLPILMDATCNGLQHLSAMVNDCVLAEKVNLLKSTEKDDPRDLYSEVIPHIKKEIFKKTKSCDHINLEEINIERSLVKRGLMTITYGATERGIYDQIVSKYFEKKWDQHLKKFYFTCIDSDIAPKETRFTQQNISVLSTIIFNSLFKIHPELKRLMNYFYEIVEVLCKLGLPVNWVTPYGLVIQQKYNKFTKYEQTAYYAGKRRKIILRKAEEETISRQKQKQAFIPNFVHSMDSSNIVLLLNTIEKEGRNIVFASIHDCFATHANDTAWLAWYVKHSFIKIYSDSEFLLRFHKIIQLRIEANFGKDAHFNDDKILTHITKENGTDLPEIIEIPKPINVNKNNKIFNEIQESTYFIS